MMTPKKVKRQNSTNTDKFWDKYDQQGFADDVLDLEIKIERGKFTIKDIDFLVFLYSQAIEHYEGIDPDKHVSFYQRTQRLMSKPSVFALLREKNKTSIEWPYNECYTHEGNLNSIIPNNIPINNNINTGNRKKLDMNILLMQEKEDKQFHVIQNHERVLHQKSQLLENDMVRNTLILTYFY